MPIQLSGLGGFDSSSLVSQLVQVAQRPVTLLNSKKGQVDSASLTLSSFTTKLSALKNAATALSTTTGFVSMAATSTDTGLVGSVTGDATAGSYSVNVTQLAKAQKSRSDAQASSTTALGQAGDLDLQIGAGAPIKVAVVATDTLTDIAAKINLSGARVSAGIINAGGSFRLSLQGLDTGATNAITVTEGGSINLGLTNPANQVEAAQDAMLTVDGLPVTRPTNSVSDAIPGVKMALTKTTTSPATLTVAGDTSTLKSKLSAFVSAYNDIVSTANSATGYGTSKATNAVLAGEPALRKSRDQISALVASKVTGASASYQSLGSVGLNLGKDGTMTFDATKLEAALAKDSAAVSRLFVTDTGSGATGVMKTIADLATSLTGTNGLVSSRQTALSAQSRNIAKSMEEKQKRIDDYEAGLKRQFAAMDEAMSKYSAMSSSLGAITSLTY